MNKVAKSAMLKFIASVALLASVVTCFAYFATRAPEQVEQQNQLILGSGAGSGSGESSSTSAELLAEGDINFVVGPEAATGSGSGD